MTFPMPWLLGALAPRFGISEVVTLSGTSGSPNVSVETRPESQTAVASWDFRTDGSIFYRASQSLVEWTNTDEWLPTAPTKTYYLEAVVDSGDAPTTGTVGAGVWQSLAIQRLWTWEVSGTTGATYEGTIRIRISDQSDGSNILATGYYRGSANIFGI